MKRLIVLAFAFLIIPLAADAQTRIELRGGSTVGSVSNSLAGLDITPSVSFDFMARQALTPMYGIYGGISWLSFGCENGYCAHHGPRMVKGYHAFIGGELFYNSLWARTGMMYGKVVIGSNTRVTDAGFGVQGAAGVLLEAGSFQITPGLSLKRLAMSSTNTSAHAVTLSADIGFAFVFGGRGQR